MTVQFYKYHGAGNDFLIADNRDGHLSLSAAQIRHLCNRHTGFGADGVILLEASKTKDFGMVFFNPDGSGGMMCGNGGRCIVAFAADRGAVGTDRQVEFEAPDGPHSAKFVESGSGNGPAVICLKMKDVQGIIDYPDENACFLDTGTRHLVKFVSDLKDFPVLTEGRRLRYDPRFTPVGTNVNFVEPDRSSDGQLICIRTFEKGVEDETLACGTGIVASALAAYSKGISGELDSSGLASVKVKAAISMLSVDFRPEGTGPGFKAREVWLTGPAEFIGTVGIVL